MKKTDALATILALLFITACGLSEADVATSVAQTLEAKSTDTPQPTDILTATFTMMPATPTATSIYDQCEGVSRTNLLENHDASQGTAHWYVHGEAFVDDSNSSNPLFAVKNSGYLIQYIEINDKAGQYALLIAYGSHDPFNNEFGTGKPRLFGYIGSDQAKFKDTLLGDSMVNDVAEANQWGTVWGIFEITPESTVITFILEQTTRRGVQPQIARFDDVGLYIFENEVCARQLVAEYEEALLP